MLAVKLEEVGHEPKKAVALQKSEKTGSGFFFPRISRKECRLVHRDFSHNKKPVEHSW